MSEKAKNIIKQKHFKLTISFVVKFLFYLELKREEILKTKFDEKKRLHVWSTVP